MAEQRDVARLAVGSMGIVPRHIDDIAVIATSAVAGGFAPKGMSVNEAKCAIAFGLEVGLMPMQSLQSIAVINGRPSMWGFGVRGLILGSGKMARAPEETITGDGDERTAVCKMFRVGMDGAFEGRFSIGDAKRAGLLGKDTYKKFPDDMIRWRAFHRAATAGFSDVLKGLVPTEVMEHRFAEQVPAGQELQPGQFRVVDETLPVEPREVPMDANAPPAASTPEAPAPSDSTHATPSDMWKELVSLKKRLTADELALIKASAGVKVASKDMAIDDMRRLITRAQEVLRNKEE